MSKLLSLPLLACLLAAGFTSGCGNQEREISGQIFIVTKGSQNVKLGLVAVHVLTDAQIKAASERCFNRENTFTTRGFEAISDRFFDGLPPAITKSDADGQFTVRVKGKTWLLARSSRKVGNDSEAYVWAVPTEGQPPKLLLSNDNHFNDPRAFITFLQQIPGGYEPVAKAEGEAKKAVEERAAAATKLAVERAAAERARIAAEAPLATEKRLEWTGKAMRRAGFTAEQVTQTLTQGGTVVAWGSSAYGQTTIPSGLSGVVAIATGGSHSLALKSDGTVVAWGGNASGQTTIPPGLSGVTAIAAGGSHSLALKSDGTVVAWGGNDNGQTTIPSGLRGVVAIAAGGFHSLALKSDGTVVAWGGNRVGQTPMPSGLSGVAAIAAGLNHSLALKSDGTVVAWEDNDNGRTTMPSGLSGVTAIAAGGLHSLALKIK